MNGSRQINAARLRLGRKVCSVLRKLQTSWTHGDAGECPLTSQAFDPLWPDGIRYNHVLTAVRSPHACVCVSPESEDVSNAPSINGPGRHCERILSIVSSIHGESAIETDALGFMAKMLVQTTLPHRAQPGTQYTRTDGDRNAFDHGPCGCWATLRRLSTAYFDLDDNRSSANWRAKAGTGAFSVEFHGAARLAMHRRSLRNDSPVQGSDGAAFGAAISTRWKHEQATQTQIAGSNLLLAEEFHLWWAPVKLPRTQCHPVERDDQSQKFFEQLIESPVPLDPTQSH